MHRPAARAAGQGAAEESHGAAAESSGEQCDRQLDLRGAELLQRPDAQERIDRRVRDRPGETDDQHG